MAGEINRVPQGLLSLLDMKARGSAPRALSEQLIATLDAFGLYTLANREIISVSSATAGAVGLIGVAVTGTATVPPGEVWYVHSFHAATSNVLAAGTTYSVNCAVTRPNTSGSWQMLGEPRAFGPGVIASVAADWAMGPQWWAPNDSCALYVSQFVAGTAQAFNLRLMVSRFLV